MTQKERATNIDGPADREYRFEHLSTGLVLQDMYYPRDVPGPGEEIPAFDLPMIDGGRFRSADLGESGPALLVFGSTTCPVTDSGARVLRKLHARFGERIRFVIVNVREAHPGQDVLQPQTLAEKTSHAEQLRNLHDFAFEVAVDGIDGALHRALSPKPNSAYVIGKDRTILFRAQWANDEKALEHALAAVEAGETPTRTQSGGLLRPMLRTVRYIPGALDRAGKGAWPDMWKAMFPLAVTAWVINVLRFTARDI